ncbi:MULTISPECIES: hypothetical protein [Hyphomonadaceae]|jgi:hypothetical protein|uniref:hypothetical protein n=1 Tax=Hyphomonadaceae TaxID=69657 RepID=UPI0035151090
MSNPPLEEYRIGYPVAIDAPGVDGGPPKTLTAYGMQGTPALVMMLGIEAHIRVARRAHRRLYQNCEFKGFLARKQQSWSSRNTIS